MERMQLLTIYFVTQDVLKHELGAVSQSSYQFNYKIYQNTPNFFFNWEHGPLKVLYFKWSVLGVILSTLVVNISSQGNLNLLYLIKDNHEKCEHFKSFHLMTKVY